MKEMNERVEVERVMRYKIRRVRTREMLLVVGGEVGRRYVVRVGCVVMEVDGGPMVIVLNSQRSFW
jgi:hypothetical protein